jgi:hypothetical protein
MKLHIVFLPMNCYIHRWKTDEIKWIFFLCVFVINKSVDKIITDKFTDKL